MYLWGGDFEEVISLPVIFRALYLSLHPREQINGSPRPSLVHDVSEHYRFYITSVEFFSVQLAPHFIWVSNGITVHGITKKKKNLDKREIWNFKRYSNNMLLIKLLVNDIPYSVSDLMFHCGKYPGKILRINAYPIILLE